MKKISFRMDDISPDMNYDRFKNVMDIFVKYGIKPLIGVIPDNKCTKLIEYRNAASYIEDEKIWGELKKLQDEHGWEIALHGFQHLYKSDNGGILDTNQKSEFAGISYDEQEMTIASGKRILDNKGLNCISFMAPAHSFDENTLGALQRIGIKTVTDGKGVYPYKYKGCLMMPAPNAIYRKLPFGIFSVCLHSNTMNDSDMIKLEDFIKKNIKNIISFSEGVEIFKKQKKSKIVYWNIINRITERAMRFGQKIVGVIGSEGRNIR